MTAVYAWLGLRFLSVALFNLDMVWALSLLGVGLLTLFVGHQSPGADGMPGLRHRTS